jgi:hypothetical protein
MMSKKLALLAVLFLTLTIPGMSASAAQGGTDRPFTMTATGVHTVEFDIPAGRCAGEPIFQTFVHTTGTATHLGQVSVKGDHCTYWTPAGLMYADGWMEITAANGDVLYSEYAPAAVQPPAPPEPWITITRTHQTFAGGTGRFSDATGSMDCVITLKFVYPADPFRADLSASCSGTISY